MNELIRKLADQARFVKTDDYPSQDEVFEKFARLLLQECIDTLDQLPVYYKNENDREIERNTITDCIEAIEQKFGV
jgi:predicted glycosyltransferase involved in capsule biosynthesis